MISTTDSTLAWSRLALRRGSEEEAMVLLFWFKENKTRKKKSSCRSFVQTLFTRLHSPFSSLPLSLSLRRRARRKEEAVLSFSLCLALYYHPLSLDKRKVSRSYRIPTAQSFVSFF